MSKLTRYTQQLFGSTAGTNQMAEFGSFANGTPARYTGAAITPAIIQTLSNFLSGWNAAVVGNNSPCIEDMNSLCYLFAYQLSYILQEGIAEYDAGTTYFTNSIVMSGSVLYTSLQDNNTGNSVSASNNAWWAPFGNGGFFQPDTSQNSITTVSGKSLFVPFLTVSTGDTYTVNSGGRLISVDSLTVNGTVIVNGICKIIS